MLEKSTHRVEVVPVTLETHPNADSLSLVRVHGYTAIVRTAEWEGRTVGAFIPPDSLVPDTPDFAFLQGHLRIRARKLRGVQSWGLLVPAPEGSQIGDDVAGIMGVEHYEPPISMAGKSEADQTDKGPNDGDRPHYDVDALLRFNDVFVAGEPVVATEKIHGGNCRVTWDGAKLHVGTRNTWRKEHADNPWWRAIREIPGIETFLKDRPGWTVYGEVFGWVQELRYGARPGHVSFRLFDILTPTRFLNVDEAAAFAAQFDIPSAPIVYTGPFDLEKLKALSDGPSLIPGANHIREGIVVRPVVERWNNEIGRVLLKIVNPTYLEKAK